jgi:hypothetical protein
VVDVSAHQGYTLCLGKVLYLGKPQDRTFRSVKQTPTTDRPPIPDAKPIAKNQRKGAPRKYDGKVDLSDLSRLEFTGELANGTKMYSQVVWHVSLKRKIRIVCLGLLHGRETRPQRLRYLVDQHHPDKLPVALLFSTDTTIAPIRLYEYYKSRFQIAELGRTGDPSMTHTQAEFIFRDAKQFTGLCDCQSRQQQSLDFHFNASLAALNIAKLEQQKTQLDTGEDSQPQSFSMATYNRLALNGHLLDRFISILGLDPTLIKSHPNYDSLLQYGSLAP